MAIKVTMQDIANETGFSRNTISKALNGNPAVPEATRNQILAKAAEMNYKHFALAESAAIKKQGGTIALFTHNMPNNSHFGSQLISSFTERIGLAGYTLTMYPIQETDVSNLRIPANFSKDDVAGILCIELFDPVYSRFLSEVGLPLVFADTYRQANQDGLAADLIMMENQFSVKRLVQEMLKKGNKSIGFVGDKEHCNSFYERWLGYCGALQDAGQSPNYAASILEPDSQFYGSKSWLREQLGKMQNLPDAFMCANDYIAVGLLEALRQMDISVPAQVSVAGFDDSPESRIVEPKLTTVRIPGRDMGLIAARMMLDRIDLPELPHQRIYVNTELKIRESL